MNNGGTEGCLVDRSKVFKFGGKGKCHHIILKEMIVDRACIVVSGTNDAVSGIRSVLCFMFFVGLRFRSFIIILYNFQSGSGSAFILPSKAHLHSS